MTGIQLSEDRRKAIAITLVDFYEEVFDETPSDYQTDRLLADILC